MALGVTVGGSLAAMLPIEPSVGAAGVDIAVDGVDGIVAGWSPQPATFDASITKQIRRMNTRGFLYLTQLLYTVAR
ncbi:MAG TPA: hypothetical protein VFU22_33425, partial [Roseiflexaceae bacterium]|nr:hypothetical protein [Roseiflexaceae bacterium]